MKTLLQHIAQAVSMYLPLLLLMALSGLSYWIWQNNPAPAKPGTERPPVPPPEMVMFGAGVQRFDAQSGDLRQALEGRVMLRHVAQAMVEVQQAVGWQQAADGTLTNFSANTAWVTEDMDEARLVGKAQVQSQTPGLPASRISGENLHLFAVARVVQSDEPVEFNRGSDQVRAGSMRYDDISGVLTLGGRVHATLVPSAAANP